MRNPLQRALDFAVAKEVEAEAFYKKWAEAAGDPAVRMLFGELGAAEHGHAEMLRHVTPADLLGRRELPGGDLGLSEMLVDVAPSPSLSLQEALILAMKREDVSVRVYERLAGFGGETSSLFQSLAREERGHRRRLESLYDDVVLREN
ncbi:MAG: ferritin family protein [Candidatus Bipolaricaulota bacterium]